MKKGSPYNPLDKKNLAVSVTDALLDRPVEPLPPGEPFLGAGICAIYYVGPFSTYRRIAEENRNGRFRRPIYVGKAVPAGTRKGRYKLDIPPGPVLFRRVSEHADSIEKAINLVLQNFYCRYLIVEDIWMPLAESLLIEMFDPVWNKVIDGFGNRDPGRGRYNQQRSAWDALHPGRPWAEKLRPNPNSRHELERMVEEFLKDQ